MNDKTFSPSRVVLARERRGLTKVALARRAAISTRSLYDIETGQATPTAETLAAIAEALRFPIDFFYRGEIVAPEAESASFRSLRSMTAAKRDAALAAGALAFELSEWIEQRYELPEANLPDLRHYEPEAAAEALRGYWGIGQSAVGNMIHLVESEGVRVFSLSEDRRVDAFSLWHKGLPFIFLNTVKTAEHSRMDAAHELGHLVLHRHDGAAQGRNVEYEAQAFAAAFLMPKASVFAAPRLAAPTVSHLVQLKKRWKVSAAALARRLYELELLSEWNYRGLCVQLSKLGRTIEPDGIDRETSQVMAKVFSPFDKSSASKNDAATELALYQADVEALVFGLRATQKLEESALKPRISSPKPRIYRVV